MIGTFFTNLAKNIMKNKHLISLYQTSCTMIKNGLATLPSLMETTYTYLIESIKILLVIILGVSVILLGIIWGITSFTFDELFSVVRGQHPPFLKLLLSKKISYETFSVFETLLGFVTRWDRQVAEKVVWKDYSRRIKKFLPFHSYNRTSAKLTMKEIFTNG